MDNQNSEYIVCGSCKMFIDCKFNRFSKEQLTIARAHDLACLLNPGSVPAIARDNIIR